MKILILIALALILILLSCGNEIKVGLFDENSNGLDVKYEVHIYCHSANENDDGWCDRIGNLNRGIL